MFFIIVIIASFLSNALFAFAILKNVILSPLEDRSKSEKRIAMMQFVALLVSNVALWQQISIYLNE